MGILTHPLNRANPFCQTHFCLTLFCLPYVLLAVNFSFAHKMAGRHNCELPWNVLWKNLPYFQVLVPILLGKCSNLPYLLTKNIGRSSLAIVFVWLCCCEFRSPCYCQRRSWLGLVSSPFLRGWGVISCPFLHYKTFPQVLLMWLISRRGGEGMHWRRRLRILRLALIPLHSYGVFIWWGPLFSLSFPLRFPSCHPPHAHS